MTARGAAQRAVLIAGPTASGKSALALALAQELGGTVINADSMQVYRDLRIVTARPTPQDEALLRQFAAHVAVAIENARLFESERHYVDTLETLAEIGREMSSILDLDALLTRIASLTKRLIDYRTFGILLLDEETEQLDRETTYGPGDPEFDRLSGIELYVAQFWPVHSDVSTPLTENAS